MYIVLVIFKCFFFLFFRLLVGVFFSNVILVFGGEILEKYGIVFKCEYKLNLKLCMEIVVDY